MFKGSTVSAVIFAGGVGKRMHSKDLPKQFLVVHGKPILIRTVEVFQKTSAVDHIVVVCTAGWINHCRNLIHEFGLSKVNCVVPGGKTGQLSIYAGLQAAQELSDASHTIVLIHDGVRPLIDSKTINSNIEAVYQFGSAITCVPAKETILVHDKTIKIIPRQSAFLARAPQSFWLSDILNAHHHAMQEHHTNFIDSATLMQANGVELHLIKGSYRNIKITTQDDYFALRAVLDSQENSQLWNE